LLQSTCNFANILLTEFRSTHKTKANRRVTDRLEEVRHQIITEDGLLRRVANTRKQREFRASPSLTTAQHLDFYGLVYGFFYLNSLPLCLRPYRRNYPSP